MGGFWRRGGGASRDRDGARPGDLDSGLSGQTGISQPEKATLGRGGRRSGQGLRPGDRMGGREEGLGALGLDAAALREAGTRVPASVPTSRRSYLVSRSSGHCPLWVLAAGLSLPGPRVPVPVPVPGSLSPTSSLPLPPASQQSSQGHPWAHKIKYLKDVGNVSRFLWQQENNSHFPDTLKESTFPLALRVANYF